MSEAGTDKPDVRVAYLDDSIYVDLEGYYHFFDDRKGYDPKIVADDMVQIYDHFYDDFHIPRAVALYFSDVEPNLLRQEGCSQVAVVDWAVAPEQRNKILRLIKEPEVVDVDRITPDVLREVINANISRATDARMARACDTIEVRAAEFTDMPRPTDTTGAHDGNTLDLRGLNSGFELQIGNRGIPTGINLDVTVGRGLYAVEGMAGTKRLQAKIAAIFKAMPHLEEREAFEPIPPDHWSLYYT